MSASVHKLSMTFHWFQDNVTGWLRRCFGEKIAHDKKERGYRFLEEALELVQAAGHCDRSEAHQLVDYVFNRPTGEVPQEVGGVMVTLAAFCHASGVDLSAAASEELERISTPEMVQKIRQKQANKPQFSPLPESPKPEDRHES